jgi:phosphoribosylglycinamide formyltransferase 1
VEGQFVSQSPLQIAILASGKGSNARRIIEWSEQNRALVQVTTVILDRSSPIESWLKEKGVPFKVIQFSERDQWKAALRESGAKWLCLAGFLRVLSGELLSGFSDEAGFYRVLNIHPSLLPAYRGLGAYEKAYRDNVKWSGVTVHLVDEGMDTGPILLQQPFPRFAEDSLADFENRGRALEHQLYVKAIELIASGRWHFSPLRGAWAGRKVGEW